MKNINFKLFSTFCFIFLMFSIQESKATHFMGADITYTCSSNQTTGANTYNLQLRLFRDCNGIGFGTTATVDFVSPTCGVFSVTLDLLPNYPIDITNNCSSMPSACNGGTIGSYGVHEYVYKKSITLPWPKF